MKTTKAARERLWRTTALVPDTGLARDIHALLDDLAKAEKALEPLAGLWNEEIEHMDDGAQLTAEYSLTAGEVKLARAYLRERKG